MLFKMLNGDKLTATVPLSWKHSFDNGVKIPHKQRTCSECKNDLLFDKCEKLVNHTKDFSRNLNELKLKSANKCRRRLP